MGANSLRDVSGTAQRAIVVCILLYFALVIYASVSGNWTADVAADVLFGFIAIGIGVILYTQSDDGFSPLTGAGLCLLAGGVAQLGWVFTAELVLNLVATVAVLAGALLYIYAVWIAN